MNTFEGGATTMQVNTQSIGTNVSQRSFESSAQTRLSDEGAFENNRNSGGQSERFEGFARYESREDFSSRVVKKVSRDGVGGAFEALVRGEFGGKRDDKKGQVRQDRQEQEQRENSDVGISDEIAVPLDEPGARNDNGEQLEGEFNLEEQEGVQEEVLEKDPLYQQIVGEMVLSRQKSGEKIDLNEISNEAKKEYKVRKNDSELELSEEELRVKEEAQAKVVEKSPLVERVKALEDQLAYVKYVNVELIKFIEQLLKILDKKKELEDKDKPNALKILINFISLLLSAISTGDDEEREKKAREVEEKMKKAFAEVESYRSGEAANISESSSEGNSPKST